MTTKEERKQQLLRAGEESQIAATWMADHVDDYVQSQQNAKIIVAYLDQKGLPFTHKSLTEAFVCLKSTGWDFAKVNTPTIPLIPAAVVPVIPAVPVEEPLPSVPRYMDHIRTSKDIRDLNPETFRKWRRGPDRDVFFKRLEAVKQRGL